MHILQGYAAVYECHVGNAGDLLLVWHREGDAAYILRLSSHDQVLGRCGRYTELQQMDQGYVYQA